MALAGGGFISLQGAFSGQRRLTTTIADAQTAMKVLTDQLLQAGAGLPTVPEPVSAIDEADSTRLTFAGNLRGVTTALSAPALAGSEALTVTSSAGFRAGDTVYVTWTDFWEQATISQADDYWLELDAPLLFNFPAGAQVQATEQVTFEWIDGALVRNGKRLIGNVESLAFSYDAAEPGSVRTVSISMAVRTPDIDPVTKAHRRVTLSSRVSPPNLNLGR